ncbi:MAG: hypothetical protein CVU39_05175 [Chloroflexi bacterium HGW-Chloroflexi-10]|nr:MAG: hypothetical protein CVU39_05175 [Chloroflexi bacterium HGW-Chloroflexi-10]
MEANVRMILFKEDQVNHAAEAIGTLHKQGITDKDITVISGVPFSEKILGRPMSWTRIPQIGMAGALVGFIIASLLNFLTPHLYKMTVGGMPLTPIPTSIVVTFELTMLGLLISTFLGVFVETISPTYGPKGYHPKISDGYIGILFRCPAQVEEDTCNELQDMGAEIVDPAEVKNP